MACWLYGEIYKARNDFLHGNPVPESRLRLKGSKRLLFHYTALLYRVALTGFLPVKWTKRWPATNDSERGKYIAERMEYLSYQGTIERALQTARVANKAKASGTGSANAG